jgi:BirA family transcriptional regulator, biotin operon repressor / biotin---[acetyl-CoA-carboxylase] ligase
MTSQPFDLNRIRSSGLVREVEFHAEIGSTNDRAMELARDPTLECPFLILAARQSSGRGRGSNRWWSGPGALMFTLILDARGTNLPTERWPQLALAAGGAVCQAIALAIPDAAARVKWPNDVYLTGKKTAGILAEVPSDAAGRLLIGIGINVNNSLAAAPLELTQTATSMTDVAHQTFDLTEVLLAALASFAEWRNKLLHDPPAFFEQWRMRCLLTDKKVCVRDGSRQITGDCQGIDDSGRLKLATPAGIERLLSGTVVSFE